MFDDLIELHEQLGRMLEDLQQTFADLHPEDVAEILKNSHLKAMELAGEIEGRRQYILTEVLPQWEVTNVGLDAGMPPGAQRKTLGEGLM